MEVCTHPTINKLLCLQAYKTDSSVKEPKMPQSLVHTHSLLLSVPGLFVDINLVQLSRSVDTDSRQTTRILIKSREPVRNPVLGEFTAAPGSNHNPNQIQNWPRALFLSCMFRTAVRTTMLLSHYYTINSES